MYETTSRKIVAHGKNEFGGKETVTDHLTEGEHRLLYATLSMARRTCETRADYLAYEPRLKRMITLVESLDFNV